MKKIFLTLTGCAMAVAALLAAQSLSGNADSLYLNNIEAMAQSESDATNLADCAVTGSNVENGTEGEMYHCAANTSEYTLYACSGNVKKSSWSSEKKCVLD